MGHLKEVKQNYFKHMWCALGHVVRLELLAMAGLVHAVVPGAFTKTMSQGVKSMHEDLQ